MILVKNKQKFPINLAKLKQDARTILEALDYTDFDLGILLATPKAMHEYNLQFREKDKPTDILSFPYHHIDAGDRIEATTEDEKNLGDIILCPEYINEDLPRWNKTFQERVDILLVHGVCHLLGYDHIEDEDYAVMKLQEDALLAKINSLQE